MKTWFQAFAFKWVNLCRFTLVGVVGGGQRVFAHKAQYPILVGGCTS
jgi:hypothetical protein